MPTERPPYGRSTFWTAFLSLLLSSTALQAAPPIRTSDKNPMPACVSPGRLMAFLRDRNPNLDPRFDDIAHLYKQWGGKWRVRWDYAFFQMVIETNYLRYRRGNGRRGDVHEAQNNFAGIGATGGGVPGNRFPDVSTGVHAQIQHLVAYSGEFVDSPVAPRTGLAQDGIIAQSKRLGRPVTFGDLARRWAVDRKYGRTIDTVAGDFHDGYCKGPAPLETASESKDTKFIRIAENSAKHAAPGEAPPARKEPQRPPEKKSGAPVRTIWTRDKGLIAKPGGNEQDLNEPAAVPEAPEAEAEPAATAPTGAQAPVVPEELPATAAAAPVLDTGTIPAAPEAQTEQASVAEEASQELPTFRIAPPAMAGTMPPPSKLGGPVPIDEIAAVPQPKPARRPAAIEPSQSFNGACRVLTASYGGKTTLLVKSARNGGVELTALTVVDGFEDSMFKSYAKASAPDAEIVSQHATKDEAVAAANEVCSKGG